MYYINAQPLTPYIYTCIPDAMSNSFLVGDSCGNCVLQLHVQCCRIHLNQMRLKSVVSSVEWVLGARYASYLLQTGILTQLLRV